MKYPYNPFTVTGFADRLNTMLHQRAMSQSQLANALVIDSEIAEYLLNLS
jgi:DNA-binding Xre family transcriptional regulator